MASLLVSILIGISSTFDSRGWGLRFSPSLWRGRRVIGFLLALVIAVISLGTCLFGGMTGHHILLLASRKACNVIGSSILVCIGLWTMVQMALSRRDSRDPCALYGGFHAGFSEMMFLGLAQGLADFSVGLGIGFTTLNVALVAGMVGLMSFLSLWRPFRVRNRPFSLRMNQGLTALSGVLFIVVGLLL